MVFILGQCSASKCPTEIWGLILCLSTHITLPEHVLHDDFHGDPWRPAMLFEVEQPDIHEVFYPTRARYRERAETLPAMRSLMLVCHAWKNIIQPFLVEWLCLPPNIETIEQAVGHLRRPLAYQQLGWFVRRLELRTYSLRYDMNLHHTLATLVSLCERLEEFAYDAATNAFCDALLVILAQTSGKTLTTVVLSYQNCPFLGIVTLLNNCPKLEFLDFSAPQQAQFVDISTSYPDLPAPLTTPRPLRSLVFRYNERQPWLPNYLALLPLPHLQELALEFGEPYDQPTGFVLPDFIPFFERHGHQLLSLTLIEGVWIEDEKLLSTLLEYCPILEQLCIELYETRSIRPLSRPHTALRHVSLDDFFYPLPDVSHAQSPTLRDHVDVVRGIITALCGPDFPKLEVIRCMDIQPWTPTTRLLQLANGDYPEQYRSLAREVADICETRGVRFENCLGEPVGSDFAPRWFWRYRGDDAKNDS